MCVPCLSSPILYRKARGFANVWCRCAAMRTKRTHFSLSEIFSHGIQIVLLPVYNSGKNDPMKNQESLLSVQRKIEYIHFRHRKGTSKAAHICSMKPPPNQRKLPWKADDCKQVVVSARWSFRRYFAWLTVIRVNECDYQLFARIFGLKVAGSSLWCRYFTAIKMKDIFCL